MCVCDSFLITCLDIGPPTDVTVGLINSYWQLLYIMYVSSIHSPIILPAFCLNGVWGMFLCLCKHTKDDGRDYTLSRSSQDTLTHSDAHTEGWLRVSNQPNNACLWTVVKTHAHTGRMWPFLALSERERSRSPCMCISWPFQAEKGHVLPACPPVCPNPGPSWCVVWALCTNPQCCCINVSVN